MKFRSVVAAALLLPLMPAQAATWHGHDVLIQVDHPGTAPGNTYIDLWNHCETTGEVGPSGGIYLPLSRLTATCTDYTPPTLYNLTPVYSPIVGHTKVDLSYIAPDPANDRRFVDNDCRIASESTNEWNEIVIVVLVCTETIFTDGMEP